MLSPLSKKLVRDIATHWAQVGAIVIVVALGVVMFTAPLLAQRDLKDSIDHIYSRTRYEDFSAQVDRAPLGSVAAVRRLPNVDAAEGRFIREVLAELPGGDSITLRVITVPDRGRPSVNDLIVESGRYLSEAESGSLLAEHHLVKEFKLEPGSVITILEGAERIPLRMKASVVSPEYLRLVSRRGEFAADPTQFGVAFVAYSEAERIFGFSDEVNDYVARVKDEGRLDETIGAAGGLLKPYGLIGLTPGENEPSAAFLNLDISNIGKVAVFFTLLLMTVASLTIYITMTRIVYSQQRQIGVSRALGYGRGSVVSHYVGYGLLLGVTGAVLGIIGGYYLSIFFVNVYADVLLLPLVTTSMYWTIALAGAAAGVLFAVLGSVVPAGHAVRMRPAEAMRTEAGVSLGTGGHRRAKTGLMERLNLPAWLRVAFRNLWRNRRRTVLTCLGVIATLTLLVTATGGRDTLDYALDKSLNGVIRWDAAAIFLQPTGRDSLEGVRAIRGVIYAEPAVDAPARLTAGGSGVDVQIQAYEENSPLHGRYPTKGSKSQPGPGEILLNKGVRERLKVAKGDTVTASTRIGSLPFKVAGFVSEPLGGICYVNLSYLQGLAGGELFNMVVAKVEPGSEEAAASAMRKVPGVSRVIEKKRLYTLLENLIDTVKAMFVIFYVMAFAMGFAILFSMITVNLLERRREIATIRTLGAGRRRLFSFFTVETVTVVAAAVVPGVLLGRLLLWVVMERLLGSEVVVPESVIAGTTLAVIVLAAFAVAVLSELPSIRWLSRLDLARVTKERAD